MYLSIKYTFQAFQKDQFWLPVAIWALFVLMLALFFEGDNQANAGRAFLGFVMPLLAGGLSAYAVLEDSALELQFATARPAWRMLAERLGLVLAVILSVGLSFQGVLAVLHVDAHLGNFGAALLAWLVPCLTMISLGTLVSLLAGNSHSGAAFVGVLWITQMIARGWFAYNATARLFLLFFGAMAAGHADLPLNQAVLSVITVVGLLVSWLLIKKQERYI
jgi:hypothetical protein